MYLPINGRKPILTPTNQVRTTLSRRRKLKKLEIFLALLRLVTVVFQDGKILYAFVVFGVCKTTVAAHVHT